MSITLGGVAISDNMYLDGINNSPLASVEQLRTIDGFSVVRVTPTPGGRSLTLGSQNQSGALQGLWCSSVVDDVKVMEAAGTAITLDYHGTAYSVVVAGCEFSPLFQWEPEGPFKMFTGKISLIEV